jgi:hypothetical protein
MYAYLFGVKTPIVHVMGYFVALLRERIASFESADSLLHDSEDLDVDLIGGISINDLRKNLNEINDHMERECASAYAAPPAHSGSPARASSQRASSSSCGTTRAASSFYPPTPSWLSHV